MEQKRKNDLQAICTLIDQCDTISFDIYDTAVLRNVLNPTDLFDVVQKKINDLAIDIKEYKNLRIRAEEQSRIVTTKEDVSLHEIYTQFELLIGKNIEVEVVKQLELDTEIEFTIVNPLIKEAFDYASEKGKKIFFISDMYLPKDFINNLLCSLGYKNFELFVSNEIGKSKGSGNLYQYVSDTCQIDFSSWLHIGDNYIADYKQAIEKGIQAYHYQALRERVNLSKTYSLEYSIMKALQINAVETIENMDYWEKFGVLKVSSIFWGFTNWLIESLREKKRDNVFFLSRDGFIPFQIYEKLSLSLSDLPPARYLHASRRVYQLPNILNMNKNDALDLLTAYNPALGQRITISEVFHNIGLDQDEYIELLKDYGFNSFDDEILNDQDRERVKKMLNGIYPKVERIFQCERDILIEYLKQQGILDYKEINLVDIGWRGSTHKAIKDLTGKKVNGYYFGTSDIVYSGIRKDVEGYSFNLGSPKDHQNRIMNNVMMFELIFSAPHGSLIKLEKNQKDVIVPIFKVDIAEAYISKIYKGVMTVTEFYIKYFEYIKNINVEDCLFDYYSFISERNYGDLLEFSKLQTAVGIGDTKDAQNFVSVVKISTFKQNKSQVKFEASKNLWRDALIVYGTSDELENMGLYFQFKWMDKINWFYKERVIRGLKNPKKAYNYILRRLRKW